MQHSCVQLDDLSDEMLLTIFKKLDNITLLYSLAGVNQHLNGIAYDSTFTSRLSFVNIVPSYLIEPRSLIPYYVYPLSNPILERFCTDILPGIHQKVTWIDLESVSIERILLTTNYPNLCGIGLYNIQLQEVIDLFEDKSSFTWNYKNQILELLIDSDTKGHIIPGRENILFLNQIFTICPNLQMLNFGPSGHWCQHFWFHNSPPTAVSSTLLKFYACLENLTDCLYLLDGRFCQLRLLHVKIRMLNLSSAISNKENLPTLRSFKLHCYNPMGSYNELVLPLLHRMSYLEELDLCFEYYTEERFIDGSNLQLNIINHMPFLRKLIFNIRSYSYYYNQSNIPSLKSIQQTFKDFKNKQIICCVDYFEKLEYSLCLIYSHSYQLRKYNDISNHFQGGIFQSVRRVSLYDERPFQHEFFLRIAQSFPLLEELILTNRQPQMNKQVSKSKNNQQNLSIIKYPRLVELDLARAHRDYYKQFLIDYKMCLPNNIRVRLDYRSTRKVTRNFRRNTTRSNCEKMIYVRFLTKKTTTYVEHLKNYFPNAKIS